MSDRPVTLQIAAHHSLIIDELLCQTAVIRLYRAHRQADGIKVLLKLLTPESAARRPTRLQDEFKLLQGLDIPGIIKPLSLQEENVAPVMILDDFPGKSLETMLNAPLALLDCLNIVYEVAVILGGLHTAQITHHDIHPANFLIAPDGRVCLIDCGYASQRPSELAATIHHLDEETFGYLSPEQTGRMNRGVDYRTDFYSLGVMFYRLLTGTLPFQAHDPLEWVHCHIARLPPSPHELDPTLPLVVSDIVMKLMAKVAEERYQNAYGLQFDLEHCLAQYRATGDITPFTLGTRDVSSHFQIPHKLYGRGAEVAQLLSAFDRMTSFGQVALVLVTGSSGSGKSCLVRELHLPVIRERGYFIIGKFNQYQREIPYAVIGEAFGGLVQQILTEPEEQIAVWRAQLQSVLGENARLIVDLIPQLKLIIGPQPEVAALPPLEARHRFQRVFRHFVGLFTTKEHPIALFLDDLQWADTASLDLIVHLLAHSDTRFLMLIAAYRDNEITATHPLWNTIDAIRHAIVPQEIHLGPLQKGPLRQLLADTLHCETAHASPLAVLIQRKTDGNPFFVSQFLHRLHRDGLITFNRHGQHWQWDLDHIQAADVTDNVVELLSDKISHLSDTSQALLRLAACFGHQFVLSTLASVAQHPLAQVAQEMEPAVQQGFLQIIHTSADVASSEHQRTYRWSHDRIQQAAYTLISESERPEIHLRIGRLLWAATPAEHLAEHVFDLVSHLNLGATLVRDLNERQRLAELNLTAAVRAKRATAYAAALNYASIGVGLLPPQAWRQHYALMLSLHRELIEAQFLLGHASQAESLLDQTLAQARTPLDRANLLRFRILFANAQGNHVRELQTGLEALRILGVDIPTDLSTWPAVIEATLAHLDAALADLPIEDLLNRPAATDPTDVVAVELVYELISSSRNINQYLAIVPYLKIAELSLMHGNTAVSAVGYGGYGVALLLYRGDFDRSYRIGQMARRLANQLHRPEVIARVYLMTAIYLYSWHEPLAPAAARMPEMAAYEAEYGGLHRAAFFRFVACEHQSYSGERLDKLADTLAGALVFAKLINSTGVVENIKRLDLLVTSLRGSMANGSPPEMNSVDTVLMRLEGRTDLSAESEYCIELRRFVLFGAFEDALRLARASFPFKERQIVSWGIVLANFCHALAAAALYDAEDDGARQATLRLLQIQHGQLAKAAHRCPSNFSHMEYLLAAELARLASDHPQAIYRYEQAIAAAAQYGFSYIQGIAAERAAAACQAHGANAQAAAYLKTAQGAYASWGAEAKVKQIEARLLADSLSSSYPACLGAGPEKLDFLSIVKASQAISGEIVFDKLLHTLMQAVIENAGAQRGCLLLINAETLVLAADARVEQNTVCIQLYRQAYDLETTLPASVLNYVRRCHQTVVLADATIPTSFSADPYWAQVRPKSVLCLPILRQAKLVGLLYLEHCLVTAAFTPDRVAVLELLASQSAISLENAQLFTGLQEENRERRKVENMLREREARIRRLVEANIIGIFFWEINGVIKEANEAFLQMSGYSRQDLLSGKVDWSTITPPEYHAVDQRAIDELMHTGTCTPYEKEYLRQDGRRVPILLGGALIEGSQDTGVAFVLDLTERKQAEAERVARHAAEAASTAKSTFLANMSHELRSPLNAILGFTRLLNHQPGLPHQVQVDLRTIQRSGEHLHNLINQVLDLAKIEAGKATVHEADFDVEQLLEDLKDMFIVTAQNKGLQLLVEHANTIPRNIHTDPMKLRQVLTNLLSNALKFTHAGYVKLEVAWQESNEQLIFAVSDTGPGIAADELALLGGHFMQAQAGRQAQEGTGLGLAISRHFVQLMGGELQLSSELGQGTTVRFNLPVRIVLHPLLASPEMSRPVLALVAGEPRYRILVVDDRSDARQLLLRLLAPLGFELREASNGKEAVELWQAWQPKLIFMDMRMPVMDGREATRRIKASDQGRATVIVALTASSLEEERADTLAEGCDDYMRKPFHEAELFALMRKHLGVRFVYQEESSPATGSPAQIDAPMLAALPCALRSALEQALTELDAAAVTNVIQKIQEHDIVLAANLESLANEFQYDRILHLIQNNDAGLAGDIDAGHQECS